MKKFVLNIVKFSWVTLTAMLLLVIGTKVYTKQTFDFKIPLNKNILVLGNSKPECAIDDTNFSNAFNLAQAGTAYFYDYIKAKEVLKNNTQIDTLILGYSYGDIAIEMDSWFKGDDKIKFKMINFFFLFSTNDYLSLLKSNPKSVLFNTPQTIFHNLKMSYKGFQNLGGFKPLTRNKVVEAKKRVENKTSFRTKELSKYQTKYLLKIYDYCNARNITLVLLAVPIHPRMEELQAELKQNYCNFATQYMPEAVLIDHSGFKIPERNYADLAHLNFNGAQLYSTFLKKNKFLENHVDCEEYISKQ